MVSESLSAANTKRQQEIRNASSPERTLQGVIEALDGKTDGNPSRDLLLSSLTCLSKLPNPLSTPTPDETQADIAKLSEQVSKHLKLAFDLLPAVTNLATVNDEPQSLTVEAALACLDSLVSEWGCEIEDSTKVLVTTYTDSQDPWTTSAAATFATHILERGISESETTDFIKSSVLQGFLQPLFSKSTSKVTASGRPSRFPDQGIKSQRGLGPPAWKQKGVQAISISRWAVKTSTEDFIHQNWPLFTPVLLAIAEDEDHSFRIAGLDILAEFLRKCPSSTLSSTGIGMVFQDAIFPSLMYLPSLTPEIESAKLLSEAYKGLFVLTDKEMESSSTTGRKLLDKIVRDGILAAFAHASNYVLIVETLMKTTVSALNRLGISSTKHLQNILSMISSVMTDPFIFSRPSVVLEAIRALNATVINCWPRISEAGYEGEIIRIVATCWLNMDDSDAIEGSGASVTLPEVQLTLRHTTGILRSLREAHGVSVDLEVEELWEREPKLKDLFESEKAAMG